MATPLVTTTDLAHRLKQTVLAHPDTGALAVAGASGMVRAISGQEISFVSQETVELVGGGRMLRLPQRPLVVDVDNPLTVVEAEYFGSPPVTLVEGRDFERHGDELERGQPWWWARPGRLMGWPRRYPYGVWAPRVRVTYSHGYTTIPDHVVKIVLDIASLLYNNPSLLRSHSIDDFSEQFATEVLGLATVEGIRTQLHGVGVKRGTHSIRPM